MDFTIITPSYNQLSHIKCCVKSVRDQATQDLKIHHHIQDAGSDDGTREFLEKIGECGGFVELGVNASAVNVQTSNNIDQFFNYSFSFQSEKDGGMYDAINKASENYRLGSEFIGSENECHSHKASNVTLCETDYCDHQVNSNLMSLNSSDSVIAWLNCDEQYLPGTLARVADFLQNHTDVDLLCGSMLMIDNNGKLLSCRKAMPMRKIFLEASYLYNFSCAMFFRRNLWEKLDGFNTDYKNAGDADLVRRALIAGARTAVLNEYLSTFSYDEQNLSSKPEAVEEHERQKKENVFWLKVLKPFINLLRLLEKWLRGGHRQVGPIDYQIYIRDLEVRQKFVCNNPSTRWPGHTRPYLFNHRLRS